MTTKPALRLRTGAAALILLTAVLAGGEVRAQAGNGIPDFSGYWQHGIGGIEYIPPASGPGPVMDMARRGGCPPAGDRDTNMRSRSPLCGARTAGIPFVAIPTIRS